MAVVIIILKGYLLFTITVMLIYTIRHFIFTINRLFGEQKIYYHDLVDTDQKRVTVVIPMHNEEKVAANILEYLLRTDYDRDKLEIIPINDFSTDKTKEILTITPPAIRNLLNLSTAHPAIGVNPLL